MSCGVTRNWNATSLNDWKFVVLVVMPLMGSASRQPSAPPISAMITDSITNDAMIATGLNPSTSSVAISRVRPLTAANIVFAAPKSAPTAMMIVMKTPRTRDHRGRALRTARRRTRSSRFDAGRPGADRFSAPS